MLQEGVADELAKYDERLAAHKEMVAAEVEDYIEARADAACAEIDKQLYHWIQHLPANIRQKPFRDVCPELFEATPSEAQEQAELEAIQEAQESKAVVIDALKKFTGECARALKEVDA